MLADRSKSRSGLGSGSARQSGRSDVDLRLRAAMTLPFATGHLYSKLTVPHGCSAKDLHTLARVHRRSSHIHTDLSTNRTAAVCTDLNETKGKSPQSITERRVPKLIPVLGSQPAGDVSHKPGGRLLLLSARPAVTLATLKRAATNFAAW